MEKEYKYKNRLFTINDSVQPNIKITLKGTKRYGYVGIAPLTDGLYTWTKFNSEATEKGVIPKIVNHKRMHNKLKKTINELCKELLDDNKYDEEMMLRGEHRKIARQRIVEFMDNL